MPAYTPWLLATAILVLAAPLAMWLGRSAGRRTARALPAAAVALWVFSAFFKADPPPPRAERVHKDEEDAGAPPATGEAARAHANAPRGPGGGRNRTRGVHG